MLAGVHTSRRFPSLAAGVFEYAIAFETLGLGGADVRQRMESMLPTRSSLLHWDRLLAEASEHADIRAGFRILPCSAVEFGSDRMRLDGVQFVVGPMIGSQIRRATELAIFVATTGIDLERWLQSAYLREDPALRDAATCLCGFALQSALEWIERRITDTAKSAQLGITNRFSPGYCTWSAVEQTKLFALLPQGFCGVNIGNDGTMEPTHSVSGVMGFGPEAKRLTFQCQTCPIEDCQEPMQNV